MVVSKRILFLPTTPGLILILFDFDNHELLKLILDDAFIDPFGNHLDVDSDTLIKQICISTNNLLRCCSVQHFQNARDELSSFFIIGLFEQFNNTLHQLKSLLDLIPNFLQGEPFSCYFCIEHNHHCFVVLDDLSKSTTKSLANCPLLNTVCAYISFNLQIMRWQSPNLFC